MLHPPSHGFMPPARRAPAHGLAHRATLGAVALALAVAGAATFAPGGGSVTDEGLAAALPASLAALVVLLVCLLAWLGRGEGGDRP